MRGLLVLCVLIALATAFAAEQQAQVSEEKKDVETPAVSSDDAQEVGKHHPHGPHDHEWDHHHPHDDHNNDHHPHDDHNDHHHHPHDDHNNDHHPHDDHNDDHHHHHDDHNDDHHHNPDPVNLCAGARADRWHLPFPKDTHKFIKCDLTTGKGTVFTCPSGLVFNAAIQVCDYP